ncbi:MAG: ParB/RepB/Spo0J family partition protein, partial [Clostridia bacterium]|nr:ParB/RepB/Spo0J family partition protein [Clostridia bacterium]
MQEQKFRFITDRLKKAVFVEEEKSADKAVGIRVDEIMPNPYQPRRYFDIAALEELTASIKQVGVITPVTVRRVSYGYELVCGERRLRAAKAAGLETIPAIVTDLTDRESAVFAITENLQRKDLTFFEEAESMKNLIEFHNVTQEQVAESLGKSQAAVANKLRLLKLPESVRTAVTEGGLCERHARALLRLPREDMQLEVAHRAADGQLNVAATEKLIEKLLEEEPKRKMMLREVSTFEKSKRLFKNTLTKTVEMLRRGGLSPDITENDGENFVEYIIK